MLKKKRILVVGTTIDYVGLLKERYPKRVFFVTDIEEGAKYNQSEVDLSSEIILDLQDQSAVVNSLKDYVRTNNIKFSGIACFDCESLTLASVVAQQFGLSFSNIETLINCRSKFLSKNIWKKNGVVCPDAVLVYSENDVLKSFDSISGPVVVKPLTGSGSELVYYCEDQDKCHESCKIVFDKLRRHSNNGMYTSRHMPKTEDPRKVILMEQYIPGLEYSCDFIVKGQTLQLIRLTRKYYLPQSDFGTILAYELPAKLPKGFDLKKVKEILLKASHALGIKSSMVMADFKVHNNQVFLLEVTPRPGGDCLPPLIKASCGFDILKAALDFAERKLVVIPDDECWDRVVGLHLIATKCGIVKMIDAKAIDSDSRVVECRLRCAKGDMIKLPPEDYDTRILGYVIFKPDLDKSVEDQCIELSQKLIVEIE
ncbi:MAG: ATP-grasp domain-containing protein [Candidatus Omnitrophica bacterium]|nr:ATP-grasp domain-containing protein [Candidatus Omnitrophota bacterium]